MEAGNDWRTLTSPQPFSTLLVAHQVSVISHAIVLSVIRAMGDAIAKNQTQVDFRHGRQVAIDHSGRRGDGRRKKKISVRLKTMSMRHNLGVIGEDGDGS
jgi:hypothetical protein